MSVFVGGLISIIIFYVLILGVGIWAGKKQKSTEKNPDTEEIMLAGRNIGLIVGIFTMTGELRQLNWAMFWAILSFCFSFLKRLGSVAASSTAQLKWSIQQDSSGVRRPWAMHSVSSSAVSCSLAR